MRGGDIGIDIPVKGGRIRLEILGGGGGGPQRALPALAEAARKMSGVSAVVMIYIKGVLLESNQKM